MVCVAAFIILCLLSVFVGFFSIFMPEIGKKWWVVFKKSWGCVGKRVTFKKCDTNFKDDIKNVLFKRLVFKKPQLIKPLSVLIEILSILIVFITIWSIIIAIKSLLALWIFDTCNISKPSQCGLGAEACTVDIEDDGGVFGFIEKEKREWGEIFSGIPDRLKTWKVEDYRFKVAVSQNREKSKKMLKIFDPGCVVCMNSFRKQIKSEKIKDYNLILVPYVLKDQEGKEKFKNSELITKFILAAEIVENKGYNFINKLFTEYKNDINYQSLFGVFLDEEMAKKELETWVDEICEQKEEVKKKVNSNEINEIIKENNQIIEKEIKIKAIPTLIYDGKRKVGSYKD